MSRENAERLSCIVVDDNYEIFILLQAALADTYVCEYAPDAFSAHQLMTQKKFDIMLCDVRMPHMDGFDLVEELNRKHVNLPIIFISGMINPEAVRRAFQLGASNVISKPISLQELRDKIKLAIEIHQRKSEQQDLSDQEIGHVYNLLKTYYYDIHEIYLQIQLYHIPMTVVKNELEKKQRLGKCFLDSPESIRFLARAA